jgi:hypothetical protein
MACFEFATELIAAYLAGDLRERKTTAVAGLRYASNTGRQNFVN